MECKPAQNKSNVGKIMHPQL